MRIIETNEALAAFIEELSTAPYLALDTEFLRDQTYYPKLCLIQVAAPGAEGDHRSAGAGSGPHALLRTVEAARHRQGAACRRQDIEIFYLRAV